MFTQRRPGSSAPVVGDPFWANVSLLLSMDGAQDSTTILDRSVNNHAVVASGNARLVTADPKWGSASATFDGTGDYLTAPAHASLDLTAGDWTIEMWVNQPTHHDNSYLWTSVTGAGHYTIILRIVGRQVSLLVSDSGYTYFVNLQAGVVINDNEWTHVAATKAGTTYRLFQGGVQHGGNVLSTTAMASSGAFTHSIGGRADAAANAYIGKIDDLRITKGHARYLRNFTPPIAPFPATALLPASVATVLLHGEGAEGGTVFVDSSSYANTVTNAGSATTSSALGFVAGTSALRVVGTGGTKGLLIAAQPANNFGTGPFTIEGWWNFDSVSGVARDMFHLRNAALGSYIQIRSEVFSANRCFSFELQNLGSGTTTVVTPLSGWHHVCLMRSGAVFRLYVDGVQKYNWGANTVTNLFDASGTGYVMGIRGFDGACDEFRISPFALYAITGFTVPTPPLT